MEQSVYGMGVLKMVNEKRLVYATDVKELINGLESLPWEEVVDDLVDALPTVDAVEVVHARWRWGFNSMNQYGAWCAECECGWEDKGNDDDFIRVQGLVIAHKYCPNCGAKMDGGNEDV
jgi:hypothetical protein